MKKGDTLPKMQIKSLQSQYALDTQSLANSNGPGC